MVTRWDVAPRADDEEEEEEEEEAEEESRDGNGATEPDLDTAAAVRETREGVEQEEELDHNSSLLAICVALGV